MMTAKQIETATYDELTDELAAACESTIDLRNEDQARIAMIDYRLRSWIGDCDDNANAADAVREWAKCEHAEVHDDTSIYIEEPQRGHYLDSDARMRLLAWLEATGRVAKGSA